jgi:hypothetical protein
MPKCSECGFLAVRDSFTKELAEALKHDRDTGWHHNTSDRETPAEFFCYQNSGAFAVSSNNPPEIANQVNCENTCSQFMTWRQGKNAKEHEDLELLRQVEDENRKSRELERAERQRERNDDRDARQRERTEDREAAARRFRQSEFRSWMAVVISIFAIAASILAAILRTK